MTEQTSLRNCRWTNIRLMCKSSKTNHKNPELFIIRSFGHNKNWHKIKKKRRWRRRWQRRRRRRNIGGKPGQSSTDLLCWSFDPRTGRSCLYDSLLHEKVQKYFYSSPKVLKTGHIMPERYDPSTAPHNHLHDNVSYSFIVNASKSPSHFLFQPFATQDQKSAIRTEKALKTKQNCETVSVSSWCVNRFWLVKKYCFERDFSAIINALNHRRSQFCFVLRAREKCVKTVPQTKTEQYLKSFL